MAEQEQNSEQTDNSPFPDGITNQLNQKFRLAHIDWVVVHAYDYKFGSNHVVKVFAAPYIKKESAEMRADQVFGWNNWENDFTMPDEKGRFKYTISGRVSEDTPWIPRHAAGNIDENAKGGFASDDFEIAESFAEKRAWAKIGIGRYLKRVPQTECQVSGSFKEGWNLHRFKSNVEGKKIKVYWKPPQLPEWAMHPDDNYADNNTGADPDMPSSSEGEGSKNTGRDPSNKKSKRPATKDHWNRIDSYFTNIPSDEQDKWEEYLYQNEIKDGEVVGKNRRKISAGFARKVIASMEEGYGELDADGVPEEIASKSTPQAPPSPEKK